jgi:hypothetical protein
MPTIFSPAYELLRAYRFDKGASDLLVARALFERMFYEAFKYEFAIFARNDDTSLVQKYKRWVVTQFTLEDIKKIVEQYIPQLGMKKAIFQALRSKQIQPPDEDFNFVLRRFKEGL